MQEQWVLVVCCCSTTHKPKPHFIHRMTMVLAIPQHKHTIAVTECMAIVLLPHKLCDFVDGTHFTIISDHRALHFVKSNHTHHHH